MSHFHKANDAQKHSDASISYLKFKNTCEELYIKYSSSLCVHGVVTVRNSMYGQAYWAG